MSIWIGEDNYVVRRRRAALMLAGRKIPAGKIPYQTENCRSDDCVNPEHIRTGTRKQQWDMLCRRGKMKTVEMALRTKKVISASQKVDSSVRVKIALSDEPTRVLAERYGLSDSWIQRLKQRGVRTCPIANSVFNYRP